MTKKSKKKLKPVFTQAVPRMDEVPYNCANCGDTEMDCSFCEQPIDQEEDIVCDRASGLHYHKTCWEFDRAPKISLTIALVGKKGQYLVSNNENSSDDVEVMEFEQQALIEYIINNVKLEEEKDEQV